MLQCFPDGAAAHAELFTQFEFIGQLCPRFDGGIQNVVIDLIFDLFGQKLVFKCEKSFMAFSPFVQPMGQGLPLPALSIAAFRAFLQRYISRSA